MIDLMTRDDIFQWAEVAPFYQAGLAGYSDAAMRGIARRHGCPYCVTEAMLDQFLLRGGKGLAAAQLWDQDHPIAGQLMGAVPKEMAEAARILCDLGYDVIDVNLACPVKKIRRKARGGHLLGEPQVAMAILDAVRQAVPPHVPCTVKLRRGSDDSAAALANFHQIFGTAIELGYAGATVHCRTVDQKYHGPGERVFLRRLVEQYRGATTTARGTAMGWHRLALAPGNEVTLSEIGRIRPDFLIGGSGDVWEAADIFTMIAETGVDIVSVARGCIGNPWLFAQARDLMAGRSAVAPGIFEQREVLLEHFDLSLALHGPQRAGRMMRKFGIRFARHHPDTEVVRRSFIKIESPADWHMVLETHYAEDGPGVVSAIPIEAEMAGCT